MAVSFHPSRLICLVLESVKAEAGQRSRSTLTCPFLPQLVDVRHLNSHGVLHNILTAPSFTEAVRRNTYAGGDTCGRAILVGAVMGALHGVGGENGIPKAWAGHLIADLE